MRHNCRLNLRNMVRIMSATVFFLFTFLIFFSCRHGSAKKRGEDGVSLRQVLYVQSLYNHHPGEEILPELEAVTDSMRREGRNPYYFAALNILIDRLFSVGRYVEADSLAVRMMYEAFEDNDSLAMAMAKRVRAQMFFKLSQPERALRELEPAVGFISSPIHHNVSEFGTATSIREWLWIIAREMGDTMRMNQAGMAYARMVRQNCRENNWMDSTGHYPATALAFLAERAFSRGDIRSAKLYLDSAGHEIRPSIPSRAYEHLYSVRSMVRASGRDWNGALADADTLICAHKDFPWLYVKDLLLKAGILNMAGRHEESAEVYSEYVAFRDSLSRKITDRRLQDLTLLYRTEIDREQKRAERFRLYALATVIMLLVVLLALSLLRAERVRKRNRILVERLKEFDHAAMSVVRKDEKQVSGEISLIDKLDRYMDHEKPYTDPALSRKELAEFCGISQDNLGQLIKSEKGMSVRNYINSYRLEEARHVLGSESEESIGDLAVRLGFGTSRTLQRAFKERYDMSPTQYRTATQELKGSGNQ